LLAPRLDGQLKRVCLKKIGMSRPAGLLETELTVLKGLVKLLYSFSPQCLLCRNDTAKNNS
jgi:hypothetical protein